MWIHVKKDVLQFLISPKEMGAKEGKNVMLFNNTHTYILG